MANPIMLVGPPIVGWTLDMTGQMIVRAHKEYQRLKAAGQVPKDRNAAIRLITKVVIEEAAENLGKRLGDGIVEQTLQTWTGTVVDWFFDNVFEGFGGPAKDLPVVPKPPDFSFLPALSVELKLIDKKKGAKQSEELESLVAELVGQPGFSGLWKVLVAFYPKGTHGGHLLQAAKSLKAAKDASVWPSPGTLAQLMVIAAPDITLPLAQHVERELDLHNQELAEWTAKYLAAQQAKADDGAKKAEDRQKKVDEVQDALDYFEGRGFLKY